MDFSNEIINIEELPKMEDLEYQMLQRSYITASLLSRMLWLMVLAAGGFLAYVSLLSTRGEQVQYIIIATWLVLSIWSVISIYTAYYYAGYALREKDIVFKRGWIFRKRLSIPFNRIQHCEVNQGPIERQFSISTLKIFTAGGNQSDMTIPGLLKNDAARLKQFILGQVTSDEEE